jgi:hypothetical protein
VGPETFEAVRALDDAALRELLAQGRPEQRVWAIWALALRAGEAAGAFARGQAQQPDPGVRRTLAVILASHGELDLLIELARRDPVPAVRASALQLGARLLAGGPVAPEAGGRGERRELRELRAMLEGEREPELVIAILGAVGAGAPELLIDLAARALGAPSREVQLEAADGATRARGAGARAARGCAPGPRRGRVRACHAR